jgi:hypothetical protein
MKTLAPDRLLKAFFLVLTVSIFGGSSQQTVPGPQGAKVDRARQSSPSIAPVQPKASECTALIRQFDSSQAITQQYSDLPPGARVVNGSTPNLYTMSPIELGQYTGKVMGCGTSSSKLAFSRHDAFVELAFDAGSALGMRTAAESAQAKEKDKSDESKQKIEELQTALEQSQKTVDLLVTVNHSLADSLQDLRQTYITHLNSDTQFLNTLGKTISAPPILPPLPQTFHCTSDVAGTTIYTTCR